jgi:hypothetical protein
VVAVENELFALLVVQLERSPCCHGFFLLSLSSIPIIRSLPILIVKTH